MLIGVLYALTAGLMWGLIFVGPLIVPEYPASLQSVGRYLAFGLIALPLAWHDRHRLRQLIRSDWLEALKLTVVGNFIYYLCLASAIQRTGAPVSTMIIGTLPVVISVSANLKYSHRDGKLSWRHLAPSLLLIALGLGCVNVAELQSAHAPTDMFRYVTGLVLAFIAVVCWTWYPMRNASWLRTHPDKSPTTWATAQGLVTLPLAVIGYALVWGHSAITESNFPMPFGPRPMVFIGLMIAIGLLCSWLGTLCWNQASQRLPTAKVGPLIVFETLAGLSYAFIWRHEWPPVLTLVGITCLIIGVISAMRVKSTPVIITPLQTMDGSR